MSNLIQQTTLEEQMIRLGERRFKRNWEKSRRGGYLEDNEGVLSLVGGLMVGFIEELEGWRNAKGEGEAGHNARVVSKLAGMDSGTIAFISTKYIVAGLCGQLPVTTVARQIGEALEAEQFMAAAQQQDPGMIKTVNGQIKTRNITSKGRKRGFHKRVGKLRKLVFEAWTTADRVRVGEVMLHLLQKGSTVDGKLLFAVKTVKKAKSSERHFRVHPHVLEGLFDEALMAVAEPVLLPMVVKPVSWLATKGKGGYLNHRFDFIKPYTGAPREVKDEREAFHKAHNLEEAWQAVDAVQNTPYKVNTQVLDVMFELSKLDKGFGFIADHEFLDVPEDVPGLEGEALKVHRMRKRYCYDENSKRFARRLSFARALKVAQRFRGEDRIFFPHDCDFRGRMYPIPVGLQPQGPDEIRGLLMFAEGKHPGEEGMRWLHINLANLFGEDKLSYDDRVRWTMNSMDAIKAVAADPVRFKWWQEADKPFQFLAACMDYVGVLHGQPSFVRVAMDGSCNGLQHLSAMILDPVGAKAVNLVDSDVPNDIYADVAEVTRGYLKNADPDRKFLAEELLKLRIDRKVVKRAVMVMPYGGKMESTINYVGDEILPQLKEHNTFGEENKWKAIGYLGALVYHATREVIHGGAIVMKWLQDTAGEQEGPLTWETPCGFPVYQLYLDHKTTRIKTHLEGSTVWPRIAEKTNKIKRNKMKDGIAPNFVHSIDAAHLMRTVLECKKYDVTHFHVIHDDYGTHAADAQCMYHAIRRTFYHIYKYDEPLDRFAEQYGVQCPDKLGFNIEQVIGAEHFFG